MHLKFSIHDVPYCLCCYISYTYRYRYHFAEHKVIMISQTYIIKLSGTVLITKIFFIIFVLHLPFSNKKQKVGSYNGSNASIRRGQMPFCKAPQQLLLFSKAGFPIFDGVKPSDQEYNVNWIQLVMQIFASLVTLNQQLLNLRKIMFLLLCKKEDNDSPHFTGILSVIIKGICVKFLAWCGL